MNMAANRKHDVTETLAERLRSWAINRANYRPRRLDFDRLCSQRMSSMWSFIIENVQTKQSVSEARANLALVELRDGWPEEKKQTEDKRLRELESELALVNSQSWHLESEVRVLEKELGDAGLVYEAKKQELSGTKIQRTLLLGHTERCRQDSGVLREFSRRIQNKGNSIRKSSLKEMTYFPKEGSSELGQSELESACMRNLRGLIENIASFLLLLEQSHNEGKMELNKQELDSSKDRIWTDLEHFLSQNSVDDIFASVCELTGESCTNVERQRKAINIVKDIEELRFMLEKPGELMDVSIAKPLTQSVQELLEELQADHIHQFLKAEAALKRTAVARKNLEKFKSQMTFPDEDTKQLVMCNAEIAGLEAANEMTRKLEHEFLEEKDDKLQSVARLQAIHKAIQNFSALAQEKQGLIHALVKQNAVASSREDSQKTELLEYTEKTLGSHGQKIPSLTSSLQNSVIHEVEAFLLVPVERLRLSSFNPRIPVIDFAIHSPRKPQLGQEVLTCLMEWMKVSKMETPEKLLLTLEEMMREMDDKKMDLENLTTARTDMPNIARLKQQLAAAVDLDREQDEQLTPKLQEKWISATKTLSDCLKTQDLVQCWWTQPAQDVETGLTYDGHSLHQWLDQWKILSNCARQLQLQTAH